MAKASPLEEDANTEMIKILDEIEEAATAIAASHNANIRVEKARGGKFPYLTFRAVGFVPDD
jgi:hypothetical protein